jgi:hypothetical protein
MTTRTLSPEYGYRFTNGEEAWVSPEWIEENGTPVDPESGEDGEFFAARIGMGEVEPSTLLDVWASESGEEVSVSPDFYEANGIPVDPETGEDMCYKETIQRTR